MQDHGLFQAICRVNRLDGEDKDFGYIVDYKELFGDLKTAIDEYTSGAFDGYDKEDVEGMIKSCLPEAKAYLDKTLEELDELCGGVEAPRDEINYIHFFCGDTIRDMEEEEQYARLREKLYKLIDRLIRAYATLALDMDLAGYTQEQKAEIEKEVQRYKDLKRTIGQASADFIDLKAYEPGMRFLIDNYINASDSEKLGDIEDFTLLDFVNSQRENLTQGTPEKQEGAAETIENNMRRKIVERILINPKYYSNMSVLLDEIIKERKNGTVVYKALLDRYVELAKKFTHPETDTKHYPEKIRKSAALRAIYDNSGEDVERAIAIHEAVMSKKQEGFRNNPVKERKIKKEISKILDSEEEVEEIFKVIVEQEEY